MKSILITCLILIFGGISLFAQKELSLKEAKALAKEEARALHRELREEMFLRNPQTPEEAAEVSSAFREKNFDRIVDQRLLSYEISEVVNLEDDASEKKLEKERKAEREKYKDLPVDSYERIEAQIIANEKMKIKEAKKEKSK